MQVKISLMHASMKKQKKQIIMNKQIIIIIIILTIINRIAGDSILRL